MTNTPPIKAKLAIRIYKSTTNERLRRYLEKKIAKYTGGFMYSHIIRELYEEEYGLHIGYGTYGGCWVNGQLKSQGYKIRIGNYCSFAGNISILAVNHHMDWFSTHPLLSDEIDRSKFGIFKASKNRGITEIGNDVWVGQNVVILPGCEKIGDGAIIGAGSIVTHNVPSYAIVAGNPARILRYRFDDETIAKLQASRWWEMNSEELRKKAGDIQKLLQEEK